MKKLICFILITNLFFVILNCKSQNQVDLKTKVVSITDLGKVCLRNDEINALASYLKINKKNITSALYITENEKKECYPINDKTFNYSIFEKVKKNSLNNQLTIIYKTAIIGNKKYIVIYKIKEEE